MRGFSVGLPLPVDLGQSAELFEYDNAWAHTRQKMRLLHFEMPKPLPDEAARALMRKGARRMQPVTLQALSDRGACEFAWICPGEKLVGMKGGTPAGAFAYIMKDGETNVFFPVAA